MVEVWQDWRLEQHDRILSCRVMFIHRTVVEFLRSESAASILQFKRPSDAVFDPSISLAKCFLTDIKTQPYSQSLDIVQSPVWESMRRCLNYYRFITDENGQKISRIVDELDHTMEVRWNSFDQWISGFNDRNPSVLKVVQKFNWALSELRQPCQLGNSLIFSNLQASILVLAATMGHKHYIHYKVNVGSSEIEMSQLQQAMIAAVYSASCVVREHLGAHNQTLSDIPSENRRSALSDYQSILLHLLNARRDPNEVGTSGSSPWTFALGETQTMEEHDDICSWCGILESLLQSGANVNDMAVQKAGRLHRHMTALTIVTVKIDQLSRYSRWAEVQLLENLRSQLLVRGASQRTRDEISMDGRPERESTPAPWRPDSSNPIVNLFRQVDIDPRPRMPLTLDKAWKLRPSGEASKTNIFQEAIQQLGNENSVFSRPRRVRRTKEERKKDQPHPPSHGGFNYTQYSRLDRVQRKGPEHSRDGSAATAGPRESEILKVVGASRQETPESSESDSEPRRGRRRARHDAVSNN